MDVLILNYCYSPLCKSQLAVSSTLYNNVKYLKSPLDFMVHLKLFK